MLGSFWGERSDPPAFRRGDIEAGVHNATGRTWKCFIMVDNPPNPILERSEEGLIHEAFSDEKYESGLESGTCNGCA